MFRGQFARFFFYFYFLRPPNVHPASRDPKVVPSLRFQNLKHDRNLFSAAALIFIISKFKTELCVLLFFIIKAIKRVLAQTPREPGSRLRLPVGFLPCRGSPATPRPHSSRTCPSPRHVCTVLPGTQRSGVPGEKSNLTANRLIPGGSISSQRQHLVCAPKPKPFPTWTCPQEQLVVSKPLGLATSRPDCSAARGCETSPETSHCSQLLGHLCSTQC